MTADTTIIVLLTGALFAAFMAVEVQKAIYSILWMITSNASLGLLFLYVGAHYLAAFHLLVYAGVLAVLFASTANFVQQTEEELEKEKYFYLKRSFATILLLTIALFSLYSFLKNQRLVVNTFFSATTTTSADHQSLLPLWEKANVGFGTADLRVTTITIALILFIAVFATIYFQYQERRENE